MKHNEEPLLDAPSKKSPGKKNTKKWCKGKVGVEHTPVLHPTARQYPGSTAVLSCHWSPWGTRIHYTCWCSMVCTRCGKKVEYFLKNKSQCPYYEEQPSTEELERRFPHWAARRR